MAEKDTSTPQGEITSLEQGFDLDMALGQISLGDVADIKTPVDPVKEEIVGEVGQVGKKIFHLTCVFDGVIQELRSVVEHADARSEQQGERVRQEFLRSIQDRMEVACGRHEQLKQIFWNMVYLSIGPQFSNRQLALRSGWKIVAMKGRPEIMVH